MGSIKKRKKFKKRKCAFNPRLPDSGHDLPSQVPIESLESAPMVSLSSAIKTIARMKSIYKTTRLIVQRDNCNYGAEDVPSGHQIFKQRLHNMQMLIHRGIGGAPLARISSLNDLLDHYHRIIYSIQSHVHTGPMSLESKIGYNKDIDEFQNEFELQISSIVDNGNGGNMFPNCENTVISGGNFVSASVANITYVCQHPFNLVPRPPPHYGVDSLLGEAIELDEAEIKLVPKPTHRDFIDILRKYLNMLPEIENWSCKDGPVVYGIRKRKRDEVEDEYYEDHGP